MQTMKTWQSFDKASGNGISGAATTTWYYTANRGWLKKKVYEGENDATDDYTYTAAGRLFSRVWERGISTTYGYNNAGELQSVDYSDTTPDVSYTYDRLGRQKTIVQGTNTTSCTYNLAGNLLSESYTGGTLAGLSVTNGYDQFLRRTNTVLLQGSSTVLARSTNSFDVGGRLATVGDGNGQTATYSYLAKSPLVQQIAFARAGNPVMTTTKSFDYLNRLTGISSADSQAAVLGSFAYGNNAANQRVRRTEADGSYWRYEYDALGQVKSGRKYWADGTPVAGQQFEYAHDDIGNRTRTGAGGDENGANLHYAFYTPNLLNQYSSRSATGAVDVLGIGFATNAVLVNGQAAYRKGEYFWKQVNTNNTAGPVWLGLNVTAANQASASGAVFVPRTPESFYHDLDGNLTNDGHWTYTWDGENRLVRMVANTLTGPQQRIDFEYDWKGRRIAKRVWGNTGGTGSATNSLRFVYDGWNLVAELDANASNAKVRTYLWGLDLSGSAQGAGGVGGLLALTYYGSTTTNCFVAFDGNGNVAGLVNAADRKAVAQYEYGPFGEVLRATGPIAKVNPFRFSTKYQDEETDLLYYGYRYHNAATGRWINPDPLVCNRPAILGKDVVIRELRFVFARNDGLNWVDPLGLWEGTFVVNHYDVALYGGEARSRGIPSGGTVPGFSVKYVPEKESICSCPKDKIVIVQVISHNSWFVAGKDPQVDSSDPGPLPGAYSGSRNGNLQIFDAPWNGWLFETTYTIEDCALCRTGGTPERNLGCVKFTWTKDSHKLDPEGAVRAGAPSQMWNDGVARWVATHGGGGR